MDLATQLVVVLLAVLAVVLPALLALERQIVAVVVRMGWELELGMDLEPRSSVLARPVVLTGSILQLGHICSLVQRWKSMEVAGMEMLHERLVERSALAMTMVVMYSLVCRHLTEMTVVAPLVEVL